MTIGIGVVGCGNVSAKYLATIAGAPGVELVACTDRDGERARSVGTQFGIPLVLASLEELLALPAVDMVLNLTAPMAHAEVSLAAIASGKHVYSEKPLATTLTDGVRIIEAAGRAGVRVGCAPDTFLGDGIQAMAKLITDGAIGQPLSAISILVTTGPEHFHPSPEFLYHEGAGPLFDIGPYLVTALTFLLGPVRAVTAMAATPVETRTVRVGSRAGETFPSAVPTFISCVLEFASGAVATLLQSWDVVGTTAPRLELHGTAGSIVGPSPDSWCGPLRLMRAGDEEFVEVMPEIQIGSRLGVGVLEMVSALEAGSGPAASGERGLHTLRVLQGILSSAASRQRVRLDDE
ncbi:MULTISPECIES: Gfo/Idh/MocA family oxidoreductase [Micrococcaceae]|uniref:Gfo/Idh/MocA family protein n=1 Tax=Micrococcaceae TaxID=1268 RepID=UPI001CFFB7E2|nr:MULTISPECIES: Gfo/Idh/MocA family oxidoreductase [Micrococcaceae]MCB5283712.1 1,5-anhydro-D-fructose reductase [Arthrobacter sp. ES1]MDJ0354015.1 Gfo/Idh/MocA family oxidoreductase [Pseudarthrobacter sp. PH31-O2]WGZ80887.1 Gfo/Idh/MocA family oxidoreductase [Arthrobacter sp. EM1]